MSERLETAQTLSPTEWPAQDHQGRSFLKARRRRTRHAHRHSLRFAGGATAAAGGGWSGPPPRWHRRRARPTAAGALAGQPLRGEQLCGGGGVWLGVVRGGREGKRQRPPDSRGQGAGLGTRRGREVGARGGRGLSLSEGRRRTPRQHALGVACVLSGARVGPGDDVQCTDWAAGGAMKSEQKK